MISKKLAKKTVLEHFWYTGFLHEIKLDKTDNRDIIRRNVSKKKRIHVTKIPNKQK